MAVNGSHFPTQDSLCAWQEHYLPSALRGVRSDAVAHKIALHINRFITQDVEKSLRPPGHLLLQEGAALAQATGRRRTTAKLERVQGKGKRERRVFLSADARRALADYLEEERVQDINPDLPPAQQPLFLSAVNAQPRKANCRLSRRSINLILEQIWVLAV